MKTISLITDPWRGLGFRIEVARPHSSITYYGRNYSPTYASLCRVVRLMQKGIQSYSVDKNIWSSAFDVENKELK